jgi:Type IIB DNA topoisomerase
LTESDFRDIYYRDVKLFGTQKNVDSIVDLLAYTLFVPRRCLHVVTPPDPLEGSFQKYPFQAILLFSLSCVSFVVCFGCLRSLGWDLMGGCGGEGIAFWTCIISNER